jgi:hypothetical protein
MGTILRLTIGRKLKYDGIAQLNCLRVNYEMCLDVKLLSIGSGRRLLLHGSIDYLDLWFFWVGELRQFAVSLSLLEPKAIENEMTGV